MLVDGVPVSFSMQMLSLILGNLITKETFILREVRKQRRERNLTDSTFGFSLVDVEIRKLWSKF